MKKDCKRPWRKTPWLLCLCLTICGCASSGTPKTVSAWTPPLVLLRDIEIPDRKKVQTVGDMAAIVLEDEKVMRLKNADLQALREYTQALEAR